MDSVHATALYTHCIHSKQSKTAMLDWQWESIQHLTHLVCPLCVAA